MNNIGTTGTIWFTKNELIKFIEKTFGDTTGNIGVITETTVDNDEGVVKNQTITFGLPLKY